MKNILPVLVRAAGHESDTYLAIMDEGAARANRKTIRQLAKRRLGEPDEQTSTRLKGITDLERLGRIVDGAMEAGSWQDLLNIA